MDERILERFADGVCGAAIALAFAGLAAGAGRIVLLALGLAVIALLIRPPSER